VNLGALMADDRPPRDYLALNPAQRDAYFAEGATRVRERQSREQERAKKPNGVSQGGGGELSEFRGQPKFWPAPTRTRRLTTGPAGVNFSTPRAFPPSGADAAHICALWVMGEELSPSNEASKASSVTGAPCFALNSTMH
jgi:hypothetical protein